MSAESIINSVRVVLCDHDDTLVGTIVPKWAHHKHVAKEFYRRNLSDEELREHWGKPLDKLVCLLYGTNNSAEALANNASCHERFPKVLFPDTIPALMRLHQAGKFLGVITATTRFSFEYDLQNLQIPGELFGYTQTADETDFHKPDPRVFNPAKLWLEANGIRLDEVVYIGDGLHDRRAALEAGFQFIGVETGLVTADQFRQHGVTSLSSIGKIVDLLII